jgi:hypothetical protein
MRSSHFQEPRLGKLRDQMASRSLSSVEIEMLRQELQALRHRNLQESTFEEKTDLVARLGMKSIPSEDLKSRKISCQLNLARENKEREQAGFAKVTFGGAEGTRTPDLLRAKEALSQLSYSPVCQRYYKQKRVLLTIYPEVRVKRSC